MGAHLYGKDHRGDSGGGQGGGYGGQADRCHLLGAVGAVPSLPCVGPKHLVELSHLSFEVGSSNLEQLASRVEYEMSCSAV